MHYENDHSWALTYLVPGESVLWCGKPQRYTPFTKDDVFQIPFGLFALGFSVLWEWNAIKHIPFSMDNPMLFLIGSIFKLAGFAFAMQGLYLAIGRFFHRAYLLKHTSYVITTQKVLRLWKKKVDILQSDSLTEFSVREHRDGLKSIVFDRTPYKRKQSFVNGAFALEYLSDAERALRALSTIGSASAQQ